MNAHQREKSISVATFEETKINRKYIEKKRRYFIAEYCSGDMEKSCKTFLHRSPALSTHKNQLLRRYGVRARVRHRNTKWLRYCREQKVSQSETVL